MIWATASGSDWFDQDELGQLLADGQAGVANLANEIGLAGEQVDDLFFAKADLAQSILDLGRGAQLLDAHGHAGSDAAQRTNFTTR